MAVEIKTKNEDRVKIIKPARKKRATSVQVPAIKEERAPKKERKRPVAKKMTVKKATAQENKDISLQKRIRSKKKLMQNENGGEEIKNEEEKIFVKWTGKSFLRPEGETLFYKVSLVASFLAIVWGIADGSLLSAVTFMTLAAIILFELKDVPKDVNYEINIDGISIDGRLYRFDEIRSFEIAKKGEFDVVKLQLRNSFFPIRELHLAEGQDIVYIETLLEYFLPKEMQEDMLFNFHRQDDAKRELTEDEFIDQKVNEYMNGRK